MRLGLLGGTFDPIHLGHLELAETAIRVAQLNAIYFVTSVKPPHKSEKTHANFLDRHAMVALALKGDLKLIPSSLEFDREGKSYSIDTVLQLQQMAGGASEIFFLIGLDAFLELPTWKEYHRFPELCSFIVFARPGYDEERLTQDLPDAFRPQPIGSGSRAALVPRGAHGLFLLKDFANPISSTDIRRSVRAGSSIRPWVSVDVEEYILKTKLYLS
ncbi:MAG: nicotinate-nucleotide adenylyltransferase [Acidobacteria bacterium]|nr:nicotinate-nucleotide adenylyltransferase [Acidobacteriota bacterium]MCI0622055.1 nicotinate-nucleotide adenylyltransferase [Acidobacteriota bacterium]MCI0724555.1 nicotinate-nucleotide adenylyltransferase [Acidobacteriota bacterium]